MSVVNFETLTLGSQVTGFVEPGFRSDITQDISWAPLLEYRHDLSGLFWIISLLKDNLIFKKLFIRYIYGTIRLFF